MSTFYYRYKLQVFSLLVKKDLLSVGFCRRSRVPEAVFVSDPGSNPVLLLNTWAHHMPSLSFHFLLQKAEGSSSPKGYRTASAVDISDCRLDPVSKSGLALLLHPLTPFPIRQGQICPG